MIRRLPGKPSDFGVLGVLVLSIGVVATTYIAALPPPECQISAFATRLEGRSRAQRHNAELSARSLNGAVIGPGATFSFNKKVRGWSVDQGFVRAPVSFDGELIPAFGGGVCQTSTTLYNAALLAGLAVTERHHHVFAPHYVAPGRDAAVAYPSLDLQIKNPYPYPVRIRTQTNGTQLRIEVWGKKIPTGQYSLVSRVLSREDPDTVVRRLPVRPGVPGVIRTTGATGFRIATYRIVSDPHTGKSVRERLSDDSYPAMPAIVRYGLQPLTQ